MLFLRSVELAFMKANNFFTPEWTDSSMEFYHSLCLKVLKQERFIDFVEAKQLAFMIIWLLFVLKRQCIPF